MAWKTVVAENRKILYQFSIMRTVEAGLVLQGTDVKSLRLGILSISGTYAFERNGEFWLSNFMINNLNKFSGHNQKRTHKLLLRKQEINKLAGAINKKGVTVVPRKVYFNEKGIAKVELALVSGRSKEDKRHIERKRSWEREKEKAMKNRTFSIVSLKGIPLGRLELPRPMTSRF